jgi:hypothetical protein
MLQQPKQSNEEKKLRKNAKEKERRDEISGKVNKFRPAI